MDQFWLWGIMVSPLSYDEKIAPIEYKKPIKNPHKE